MSNYSFSNFLPKYEDAHVSVDDVKRYRRRKLDVYQIEKNRFHNIKKYDQKLFLKAAQNLHLIQNDISFAENSIKYQKISINQISSIVSCMQKEIDLLSLKDKYDAKVQQLREGYMEKVNSYKKQIEIANQTNLSLLNEINQQADEAEREADKLALEDREKLKKECDNYFDDQYKSLKQQLKEAQNEITELQNLSDKATIARKRIDEFKSMKTEQNQKHVTSKYARGGTMQQQKNKNVLNSSRVGDQFRSYQEKNKKTGNRFYPENF